jgi:hypothetical protein
MTLFAAQNVVCLVGALVGLFYGCGVGRGSDLCPDEQPTPQIPTDLKLCAALDPIIRKPGVPSLEQYEAQLGEYLGAFCHRNTAAGWKMDKTVRDSGPFIVTLTNGVWSGHNYGTHKPVLIWYSPEMYAWLRANRPSDPGKAPVRPDPVPDGAIMIKEMYNSTSASACRVPNLLRLLPKEQGAAVMVRDSAAAHDGWFWGWFGWKDWKPDWPPRPGNPPPFMGFGQYCTNCHASARDNFTFATLSNIEKEPGSFLTSLSQDFFGSQRLESRADKVQKSLAQPSLDQIPRHLRSLEVAKDGEQLALAPAPAVDPIFMRELRLNSNLPPSAETTAAGLNMPSQTYDNVWVPGPDGAPIKGVSTSDQCLGCHSAGGTGLQYEMTAPGPPSDKDVGPPSPHNLLFNFSPYGTWRTSPMGLAGRDPIFFSQLASETQTFHKDISTSVQNS